MDNDNTNVMLYMCISVYYSSHYSDMALTSASYINSLLQFNKIYILII